MVPIWLSPVLHFLGVYIYGMTLWSIIQENNLWSAMFVTQTGERILATPAIVIQYMLGNYLLIFAQLFFVVAVGYVLLL